MSPSQVIESVKSKNFNIMLRPELIGADAGQPLLPLVNDPDPQVRGLAVDCLHYSGGSAARKGFLEALRDRVETIRGAAARYLRSNYSPDEIPEIRRQADQSKDEYVREQLSLLLGETGDRANIELLRRRASLEPDEHARLADFLALARLGEAESRQQLIARLADHNATVRVAALRDLPYVNDKKLLSFVLPLLDDNRDGANVGYSHGPFYKRVCDIAVDVSNEILGSPFSFVQRIKRYSDQEIAQIKKVVAGI